MINALLIDDEPAARASLALELRLHCPQLCVLGEAGSVAEALAALHQHPQAGLLFLDIQLSDGSGFDVLNSIDARRFKIIFTTAYSEYALRAIKFSPLDYLLKPIDAEELKAAVEKALQQEAPNWREHLQQLMQQFNTSLAPARIALSTADGIHLHQLKNILRCAADGNYSYVFFADGSKLLVAKTLRELEDLLLPHGFERIHKSHLINMEHLSRYHNRLSGEVEMTDGAILPVSQRKKAHLLELLSRFKG
ncbi:MAG: response regulator transcription factor [Saprospiraceae bacterium]|nr:response regulator transcription factor [Saprospiraceae bacterium]